MFLALDEIETPFCLKVGQVDLFVIRIIIFSRE